MADIDRGLRIGTRGSQLALVQAALVRDTLAAAYPALAGKGPAILVLDDVSDPVGVMGTVGEHDGAIGQIIEAKLCHRRIVGSVQGTVQAALADHCRRPGRAAWWSILHDFDRYKHPQAVSCAAAG